MLPFLPSKPIPPNVVASRDAAFADAAAAVKAAAGRAEAARAAFDAETAASAETDRERAGLAHPGVDEAAIRAYRERQADLTIKAEGHQLRLGAHQAALAAADAALAEAKAALTASKADLDAAPIDDMAALPALRAAAQETAAKAEQTSAALARAEQEGAPALSAFAALDAGAEKDAALRILKARRGALAKIDAARASRDEAEETVNAARYRLRALEARLEREQRATTLREGCQRLEAMREKLMGAIGGYNEEGARLGGLVRACDVYVKAYSRKLEFAGAGHVADRDKLMLNPQFAAAARVPVLGREFFSFVSDNWRHNYSDFEMPQGFLKPLLDGLAVSPFDAAVARRAALDAFDAEYQRLGRRLLDFNAIFFLWLSERDQIFAAAGDLANSVPKPAWPLQSGSGGDLLPWRLLSLPPLRPNTAPLWQADWSGRRLVEATRAAKAA